MNRTGPGDTSGYRRDQLAPLREQGGPAPSSAPVSIQGTPASLGSRRRLAPVGSARMLRPISDAPEGGPSGAGPMTPADGRRELGDSVVASAQKRVGSPRLRRETGTPTLMRRGVEGASGPGEYSAASGYDNNRNRNNNNDYRENHINNERNSDNNNNYRENHIGSNNNNNNNNNINNSGHSETRVSNDGEYGGAHSQGPEAVHQPLPGGAPPLRPLRKYQAPPGQRPFRFGAARPLPAVQQHELHPSDSQHGMQQQDSHRGAQGEQHPSLHLGQGDAVGPPGSVEGVAEGVAEGDEYVPAGGHIVSMGDLERRGPSEVRENVFYVENPRTGEFVRVPRSELSAAVKVSAGPHLRDDDDDADVRATTFKSFVDGLAGVVATFFLLSQGALGGFSLLQLLFTVRYPPNVDFLRYYSPLAADAQRVYFVLTTLSLLAAIDKYAKDKMGGWSGTELRQQITDSAIIACYFVAFIFSLLNANTDDLLTYSDARVPGWYDLRGIPNSFTSTLARWHVFNIIRIIGSILGWLLVSSETRNYNINASNYEELLKAKAVAGRATFN